MAQKNQLPFHLTGKQKKQLYTAITVIVVIACIVLEIGQRFPKTGLPSWDDLNGTAAPSTVAEGMLEVHVIDVGNADSILIRQNDKNMLIDAGEKDDGDTILHYLSDQGVEKLDLVIATHPHADHIGSMAKIVRNVPIGKFLIAYMPKSSTPTSSSYLNMLKALKDKAVPIEEAKPGATYALGSAQVDILAPLEETSDVNNMSIVSYLTFGEKHFLFMGDAEKPVEKLILDSGRPVRADVLKTGHHGSSNASGEEFVRKVAPSYALITCGAGNSYGHPHRETIALLKKLKIPAYRSDECGHIVLTSDGKTITVKTQKGE